MEANQSIRVYDQSLNLVGELDDYQSAYFSRSWSGIGGFSIQTNLNTPLASILQKGYFVMFSGDKYKIGLITTINKKEGEQGKGSQVVTASGYEAKVIFSWRIILPQTSSPLYSLSDSAEAVMKQLVKDQCGATADADRQFSLLTIATDQDRGGNFLLKVRYNATVADKLREISLSTGVGYFLYLDESNKKLIFECGVGLDRTATQSTNSRAIFSTKYETLREASFSDSDNQYRNYAYTAGQGVGVGRTVREVYSTSAEPTGLARKELFIDARDVQTTTDIDARAAQKLAEQDILVTVEGSPLTFSPLVYRTDYDLGDLISIDAYNSITSHRITEVKESWSYLQYSIDCVFDKEPASLPLQVNAAVESLRAQFTQTEGYILESGSNANGSYIKYSDGHMECRGSIDGAITLPLTFDANIGTYGWSFHYNVYSLSFPVQFQSAPNVLVNFVEGAPSARSITTSGFQCLVVGWYNTGSDIKYTAVGRWRA